MSESKTKTGSAKRRAAGPRCPVCNQPAAGPHRPFCSGRCKDVDLARWFAGSYRIPAAEPAPGGDGEGPGGDDEAGR